MCAMLCIQKFIVLNACVGILMIWIWLDFIMHVLNRGETAGRFYYMERKAQANNKDFKYFDRVT